MPSTITSSSSSASGDEKEKDEGSEPKELEPWHVFLKRTARWTEDQLEKANLQQWTAQWRRRKWAWAAKLLDNENQKWSSVATNWQPLLHGSVPRGRRQQGLGGGSPHVNHERDMACQQLRCPVDRQSHVPPHAAQAIDGLALVGGIRGAPPGQ